MDIYSQPLVELKEYTDIVDGLKKRETPIQVTGCVECQKCQLMHYLGKDYKYKLIIAEDEVKARKLYEDMKMYTRNIYIYPAKDIIFYTADIHSSAINSERMAVIQRIIEGEETTIIMTIEGGMDPLLPLEYMKKNTINIEAAGTLDLDELKEKLVRLGYERVVQVENKGEFAIRGGIIDVFSLNEEVPYRIEMWDDEVDTIRTFDVESQRSIEDMEKITIYPASEMIFDEKAVKNGLEKIEKEKKQYIEALRKNHKSEEANRINEIIEQLKEKIKEYNGGMGVDSFIKYFFTDTVSFFDYFDKDNAIIYIDEPIRVEEMGKMVEFEFADGMQERIEKGYVLPKQADVIYSYKEIMYKLARLTLLTVSTLDYKLGTISPVKKCDFTVRAISSYNNNFELMVKDLKKWKDIGYRIVMVSNSRTRAKRMVEDLFDEGLNAFYSEDLTKQLKEREIMVTYGNLRKGFEYPFIKYAIISDSDIFGASVKKKRKKKNYEGSQIQSFTELKVGDYIVHENHGIGRYKGIEKIEVDGIIKDYIKLEYAQGGNLYILASGLDVIQKYAGAEEKEPKLNKLNSVEWKKTKTRVKTAIKDIAKELVELYALRQSQQGYQFCEDTVWQREFEEMFPYEETQDQLDAIEATKKDMESSKIMDRLICGDVGYGKTEIAIRAAFKAVSDGKQVAFLVPTTILAQQHFNTFSQRMMDFPISVDMMSRFRTAAQQKKTLDRLQKGSLDIVIGTHRLLSKDVKFKDLGLLIVDEEQRFGVTHKEKIKQMKGDVDVLTLSATPIPRTLHMSLVGIRDMSVLEEPPVDRMPIQTYVIERNDEIIRGAIKRELARGGQVYYVYNYVSSIMEMTNSLANLVPEANVAFAHGQMSERELENIMHGFINGEIDVLVSTTIVETGLDISNVNTMIIDDADRFGLSQLYQLKGRVGRSNRTAYAFLMYKKNKSLSEEASKRLQAIKEFTSLGSGFKIAMKDLEIRGAGNLLGAKQHGHMEDVGYDLYCKMLNEAVKEIKGEKVEPDFNTAVDMDIDAYIPSSYIKSEFQKLDMYKRIAGITNDEEHLDIQAEMLDRFGDIPNCVNNLLNIALIRMLAHECYVEKLVHKGDEVKLFMYKEAKVNANAIVAFVKSYKGSLKFVPGEEVKFIYKVPVKKGKTVKKSIDFIISIRDLLDRMKADILL